MVSDDGGSSLSSYVLYSNGGSGITFTAVVGESSDSLLTTVPLSGLTEGLTYRFKYKVKNIHGLSSDFSSFVDIVAALAPDTPATATTVISDQNVRISWTPPAANGATISAYKVEIENSASAFSEETSYCDGSSAAIIAAATCDVPLTHLINSYGLQLEDLVVVRITASNSEGSSGASTVNSSGARIATEPQSPTLSQGTTSSSSIQVTWNSLSTAAETGNSAIISYNLEWDEGDGDGDFTELVGETSDFTSTSHSISSGLVAGTSYIFRIRAKNAHGWSVYSSELSIIAANEPD